MLNYSLTILPLKNSSILSVVSADEAKIKIAHTLIKLGEHDFLKRTLSNSRKSRG